MINLLDYLEENRKVKVIFFDNTYVQGYIESIDDEEESELGEMGITLNEENGLYMGIAQSEIKEIYITD